MMKKKAKKITKTNNTIIKRIREDLNVLVKLVADMGYGTSIIVNRMEVTKGYGHPLWEVTSGNKTVKFNTAPEVLDYLIDPQ